MDFDKTALSCIDIYEIIPEWDSLLWSEKTRGLRDLSPREAVEASNCAPLVADLFLFCYERDS